MSEHLWCPYEDCNGTLGGPGLECPSCLRDPGGAPNTCPQGHRLEGLATYCHECDAYVEDLVALQAGEEASQELQEAKAPPDPRTEKEIEAGIIRTLELHGYHVTKLSQPRHTMQTRGVPDLFVMGHGKWTWAEIKRRRKGRVSEHQANWHRLARENGVECRVWYDEAQALTWAKGMEEA